MPGSRADPAWPWHGRRLAALGMLAVIAPVVLLARPVHAWLLTLVGAAEPLIRHHPVWGMGAFVLLAALSAMLAFVSSALLIPVAVYVWGPGLCFVLLWIGWYLGGVAAYGVGRYLGRPAVEALVRPGVLARYEAWARPGASLVPILLLQLAVPSDIAGYLFGMVRCRFSAFLVALALAEAPYALAAVYLGQNFLQRRLPGLVVLGVVAALLSLWALRTLRRTRRGLVEEPRSAVQPARPPAGTAPERP